MSKIDDWLKPNAIVPVSFESVQLLINHIKEMYDIKKQESDIKFKTHIKWDFGWSWVDTTSTKPSNLEIVFDGETGELKSARLI